MGPLLTEDGASPLPVRDDADVSLVRQAVRERAEAAGLPRDRAESLTAAASEIAQNQIAHAGRGEVSMRTVVRRGSAGIEVRARDAGGGLKDPATALRGRPAGAATSSTSLGVGLGAAYRLADEIDFDVRWGQGSVITARKFATPLPRSEVAILGRPCDGEGISGDDGLFERRPEGLLLAVADGLGHGPLAQEASAKAMDVVRGSAATSPLALLNACHPALAPTRGAVMSIVRVAVDGSELVQAGLGNIECHLYQRSRAIRLPSNPGVVGQPGPRVRIQEQRAAIGDRLVLVMFTDGLSSRLDLAADATLLREPAIVIAHQLLTTYGRGHDDALVLVATVPGGG